MTRTSQCLLVIVALLPVLAGASDWREAFQNDWVVEKSGGAQIRDDGDGVTGIVPYGDQLVWRSRTASTGAVEAELSLQAKVSTPLRVNAIPVAISVDGSHYLHLHGNTYVSHGSRLYGDRNYNDGRGDVATVSAIPADAEWHTYRIQTSGGGVRSWIDDHPVHDEPWPFGNASWFWRILLIGDHPETVTMSLRNVRLGAVPGSAGTGNGQ